jgi:SOS regulatory protein LexA
LIDWNPAEKRAISIREDLRDAYRASLEPSFENSFESKGRAHSEGKSYQKSSRLQVAGGAAHSPQEPEERRGILPMLGAIAAGSPLQTLKDTVERIDLSEDLCPPGCYALRVRGTSMIEDHIMDDDIVIINPEAQVRQGDVVVALIDQETATLKRFYREKDRIRLQPANSEMEPIYVTDVHIQGRVEAVIRKY